MILSLKGKINVMRKCSWNSEVPLELKGEDVYDTFYIFDDEKEAIDYIVDKYHIDKNLFVLELHEEDLMRNELGKENYLRCASVSSALYLSELMSGEYILWEAY